VAPATRKAYDKLLAYNKRVGRSCLTHTGALLGNVDTVSTARDLDAARVALGAGQVSWLGVSYGSLLGQTYARLFPAHLRAAVLDGALDHSVGTTRLALDEARVAEGELALFAKWCDRTKSCALHGRDVKATYRRLLAHGVPGSATPDQIGYGVFGFMEVPARWPLLARALASATAKKPDASLLALVGAPEGAAYRATTCDDFPTDIHNYSELHTLLTKLRRAAPVFGPYVEGLDVVTGCLGWPVASRNPWGPVPVSGTPPLLVVSGAHDPSTPDAWGIGMARQIAGSRLLRWNGAGHTGYVNDAQVQSREVQYLLAPAAPVPGTTAGSRRSASPSTSRWR
jgi:pimeloyl-ACP methyl ester carboxylesterase